MGAHRHYRNVRKGGVRAGVRASKRDWAGGPRGYPSCPTKAEKIAAHPDWWRHVIMEWRETR